MWVARDPPSARIHCRWTEPLRAQGLLILFCEAFRGWLAEFAAAHDRPWLRIGHRKRLMR